MWNILIMGLIIYENRESIMGKMLLSKSSMTCEDLMIISLRMNSTA